MANPIFYPDGGLIYVLQSFLTYLETLEVRLYINDYTPAQDTTPAAFTEASFPGYARVSLSGKFGSPGVSSHKASSSSSTLTFTQTSDSSVQTVYGWCVISGDGSGVVMASRAESPVPMQYTDDECRVMVEVTDKDEQTT